ncbi:MAG: diguanylate cyclase [Pseudomonadota bacterium]
MLLFLPTSSSWAQALLPAMEKEAANITNQARYLRDPSGNITLRDIVRPAAQRGLKTLKQPYLSTALDSKATHWFKLEAVAPPDAPYEAILYFTDRDVSEFTAFLQVVGANADVLRYSRGRSGGDAVERSYGIGLPIKVAAGERRNIFVSVRGAGLSGRLELWQPAALRQHVGTENRAGIGTLIFAGVAALLAGSMALVMRASFWILLTAALAIFTFVFASSRGLYPIPSVNLGTDWQLFLKSVYAGLLLYFAGLLSGFGKQLPALGWFGTALAAATVASGVLGFFAPPQADIVIYLTIGFAGTVCFAYAAALFALKMLPEWPIRLFQTVLCAPLIALALPAPIEADVAKRWPLIIVIALVGAIAALEVFRLNQRLRGRQFDDNALEAASRPVEDMDSTLQGDQTSIAQKLGSAAALSQALVDDTPQGDETVSDSASDGLDSMPSDPTAALLPMVGQLPQSAYDSMTGVFNKATLLAIGEKILTQVRRYDRPTSAIMLQLADFDSLLESGGQSTADRAAKLLSVTCMRELRESDYLGRFYDDTFIALLPETPVEGAHIALKRACVNLTERTLPTRIGMIRLQPLVAAVGVSANHESFEAFVDDLKSQLKPSSIPFQDGKGGASQAAE